MNPCHVCEKDVVNYKPKQFICPEHGHGCRCPRVPLFPPICSEQCWREWLDDIDDEADEPEHISEQKLKPAEGLCVSLPNGKPALQFITYKDCIVTTIKVGNNVKLQVEVMEAFIKPRD